MKDEEIIASLEKHHMTVATAESCTGGLIASNLIAIPGCSEVLKVSFITYSEQMKCKYAGVKKDTLQKFGVVSRQIAEEMALGCCKEAESDFAISSTGIAGPGGGSLEKPVGLVYLGCAYHGKVFSRELHLIGDRQMIRIQAAQSAIELLGEVATEELG